MPRLPRPILLLTVLGVALRLALLFSAGGMELERDEAHYLSSALRWNHFGFYSDQFRFLWPPGYPFVLSVLLDSFGAKALFIARLLGVLASASIGLSTMLFARHLFSDRAAWIAGLIWCMHLPLAEYSTALLTETLFLAVFLPALYLLYRAGADLANGEPSGSVSRRILLAGVLFGGSLFLRDVALFFVPILALALAIAPTGRTLLARCAPASLFLLATATTILPWTLRNYEVYGRVVPIGSTLGENAYRGLNARYANSDLMDMESIRAERGLPPLASVQRSWTVELTTDQEDAWARRIRPYNTIDRLEANVDAGMRFALDHPAWFLRSRVQTFADFFSPVSYFVRHASVGRYGGPLGRRTILQILVPFATATTVCVILLGILGLFTGLVGRAQLWFIGGTVGYFTATALLISHSRFRLPIEPLLIVMASGLLTGSWRTASGPRRASALLASAVILFFWWLNGPMALSIIAMAIGVES
jgi:4-amino-4-deoxy-L-arabinose transferase-like glycosyltransferase